MCRKMIHIPTRRMCVEFAERVSDAHSWYKHLPIAYGMFINIHLIGCTFVFYLDPHAGQYLKDGEYADIEKADCFHYSTKPTTE